MSEPLDILALRALCDNATPGPWVDDDGYVWSCHRDYPDSHIGGIREDRTFIAAAREALPKALDEIERLRVQTQSDACAIAYREDEIAAMRPVVETAIKAETSFKRWFAIANQGHLAKLDEASAANQVYMTDREAEAVEVERYCRAAQEGR